MKIDVAIKLLQEDIDALCSNDPVETFESLRLGIEALKQIKYLRAFGLEAAVPILLGETEMTTPKFPQAAERAYQEAFAQALNIIRLLRRARSETA